MALGKPLSGGQSRLSAILDQTVFDPTAWAGVCDELAALVGAAGGLIIPQESARRGPGMPHSPALGELFERFIETGWYKNDFRAQGFPMAIERGFVTDHDLIEPEEMERHPYYAELIFPAGLRWFAGIAFDVEGKTWGAAVHAAAGRDAFEPDEIDRLMQVRGELSMAAARAAAVGGTRVETLEDVFASAARGVLVLDWAGRVHTTNARADELLRRLPVLSGGRLTSRDAPTDRKLAALVERLVQHRGDAVQEPARPILLQTTDGRPIGVDGFRMPRDFQALLSGACAIVTLHEMPAYERIDDGEIRALFELTAREAELAGWLATGRSLTEAAGAMGISIATARHYLKAIFAKTNTGRQAELVALLARHAG